MRLEQKARLGHASRYIPFNLLDSSGYARYARSLGKRSQPAPTATTLTEIAWPRMCACRVW